MAQKRAPKNSSVARKSTKSAKTTKPTTEETSKMTMCTVPVVASHSPPARERRTERRVASGKRLSMARAFPGRVRSVSRRSLDPCDNSNDSGLGFDNHVADHHASLTERLTWTGERAEVKRQRLNIKLEDDEVNDNFSFPETVRTCTDTMSIIRTAPAATTPALSINGAQTNGGGRSVPRCTPLNSRPTSSQPITLTSQLSNISRESDVSLRIISQPEQQHRARYQTEGSRGAVKDRSGNGFPVVQLLGYHKTATLQVFIGTDVGKVTPHMFYQACRVSGKNSTPCIEKKFDGTVVIEMQLDPSKDMIGTCDCVGILKERNVDVEHRFPDQIGSRSKKKSTRCRMVFRTTITHQNGLHETLQVCSQPIVCTQPPGIPEICKKSLTSCPATGGLELFILGKNFLKDTKVFFQQLDEQGLRWEQYVIPDKEFLQQTHLVCVIPPYARSDIVEPITVRLLVVSSGKTSEPHQFVYTPVSGAVSSVRAESSSSSSSTPFMNKVLWGSVNKHEQGIMPPPGTNQMPSSQRRPSINMNASEGNSPPLHNLKQELIIDENSQNSIIDPLELHRERYRNISESSMDVQQGDSNMAMINESSMDLLRRSSVSLDAISQNVNENSMNSMSELMARQNSTAQTIHDNSLNVSPLVANGLSLTEMTTRAEFPASMVRDELAVMDLRMKMPPATVSDLASTNAPSLATLRSFGVMEQTNTPLPAQTAQSVENYLSTIETKSVNVDALQISQMLNSATQNKIHAQKMLTAQGLLDPTSAHLSAIQSVPTFNTANSTLIPGGTVQTSNEHVLLQQNSLIPEPLTSTDRNIHSPQDMLIGNKSPQDVLLNATSTSTLMVAPSLDQQDVTANAQSASNISPDLILNSQISPSMMCRTNAALVQEGLLSTITAQQGISPLLTTDSSNTVRAPVTLSAPLTSVMSTSEPEKAILLKAAVDLLETQKKISELETLTSSGANNSIEQVIMNNILTPSSACDTPTQGNNLQQTNLTSTLIDSTKPLSVSPVKDIAGQIQTEKKNEDRMIPTGFATMSENELINIINPSCFDQGNNFH